MGPLSCRWPPRAPTARGSSSKCTCRHTLMGYTFDNTQPACKYERTCDSSSQSLSEAPPASRRRRVCSLGNLISREGRLQKWPPLLHLRGLRMLEIMSTILLRPPPPFVQLLRLRDAVSLDLRQQTSTGGCCSCGRHPRWRRGTGREEGRRAGARRAPPLREESRQRGGKSLFADQE